MKISMLLLFLTSEILAEGGTLSAPYIMLPVSFKIAPVLLDTVYVSDSISKYRNKIKGTGYLSMTKSKYKNWQQSGQDNFMFLLEFNPFLKIKSKKTTQEYKLKLKQGWSKTKNAPIEKCEDQIALSSNWKYRINNNSQWNFAIKTNSQISNTYALFEKDSTIENIIISSFLSPGYLNINGGFIFKLPANTNLELGLSSIKITSVYNQKLYTDKQKEELYKVIKGKNITVEYGFTLLLDFKKSLAKNIELIYTSKAFINKDEFDQMDIESSTEITMKVNKHLKTKITHQLIYDQDIINHSQMNQQILVGYYF